jgi:hypothetical protein
VRTLLRVLAKIVRALCFVVAAGGLCGFIFGLFLWQGGDPVGRDDILDPFLFFAVFAAAGLGLGRFTKKPPLEEPPPLEMTEEEARTLDADEKAVAAYERRRKFIKWATLGSPLWLMGGCVGYTMLDTLRGFRGSTQESYCLRNMRQFEEAVKQIEATQHHLPRSLDEVVVFSKPFDYHCVSGGTYSLVPDATGHAALSCTIHGSFDHPIPAKHRHM